MNDITDFIPDSHNANKGTERGQGLLEQSFRRFGAGRSILVDKNNKIIGGNKSHEMATQLGMKSLVVETDGDTLVVVKRKDVDLDTAEGRELALADNRVGEVNLSWDADVILDLDAADVKVGDWFFDNELAAILSGGKGPTDPAAEWKGMPEFDQKDKTAFRTLAVHFKDQAAVDAFATLVAQKIADKTRYMWFPTIEIEPYADKVYKAE